MNKLIGRTSHRLCTFSTSIREIREIKYYFNIWGIKKKKKEGGSEKRGVKIHPFHLPWIRAWNAPFLKGQDEGKETKLDEQDEHIDELKEKLQEASENRRKEIRKVLKRLVTFEAQISMSLEVVEEGPAKTDDMVGEMKLSQTKKVYEVEEECHTQPATEVERLEETRDETAEFPTRLLVPSTVNCLFFSALSTRASTGF